MSASSFLLFVPFYFVIGSHYVAVTCYGWNLLCRPDWLGTHSDAPASTPLPLSPYASHVLGLKVYTTMPGLFSFKKCFFVDGDVA